MSKTSSASKNKYNNKAYDRIPVTVPKGYKEEIKAAADKKGVSVNRFICDAIAEAMGEKNEI
jgi:predicted HicB family RNase H-like nuclease